MARPGDWNAIGLDSDPTPGDPERINALADGFQKMGTKAREIITAIEAVMNTNNDSVFVGKAADALRGKVDSRLRGHVESVAGAFESSATALRAWRNIVIEQQAKADAALNAGRGLSETDPERENQKNAAKAAGEYQTAQASAYAGRINGVSDIQLPISDCEAFWEAFKWLAIILIIPALLFGGPIALLALGVNLALFIKTIVDVAKGDAGFLDLFLAGLGLIAPTTRALPIFSIVKGVGKGLAAGAKGIAQAFRTVFSKDFLFSGLLTGLRAMPMLANIAIRETGLFVVKNLRNFPVAAAHFAGNFGTITLGAFSKLTTAIGALPGALGRGFSVVGKGLGSFATGTGQFLKAHFGGLQWTRLFLPVAGDEIRAFKALGMTDFQAFSKALKVGVLGRGVFGKDVFGLPVTSAIGRGIAAIPIEHGAGAAGGRTSFLTNLLHPEIRIPTVDFKGIGHASGAGFTAGHAFTAIDDINIAVGGIRSGDLGVSAVTSTTTVSPSGLHLPGNAGAHVPGGTVTTAIPSPHIGTPQVNQAVLPIHIANGATPPSVHTNTPHLGTADIGSSLHLSTPNFQSQALNNVGSLHIPTLPSQFGTQIGEGASHGFQANRFHLSIDEILHSPSASSFNAVHALNPPAVDRVNAALDLVHNPQATTQGVTPPALHTAKSGDTQVTVNGILSGADLKLAPPATTKLDNPSLAGAQNAPNLPAVNAESVTRLNRAADLLVQPGTMHSPGAGTTHQPGTNLPGNAGVPGHGMDTYGAVPEPLLVSVRPQTVTGVGAHNPGHSPIKGSDIGQSGIGPVTGKSEIPLPSIANRPGAYVAIERTEGGVRSFSLYGGGPDGRVDVLPGGHLRFTDTATGATTRFDSGGIVIDHGLRLTKADGMLRLTDQTLIAKPGGQLQVTSLAGEPAPNIKIQQLETGAVRLTDEKGVTFHYNAQGTLDGQPLTAIAVKPTAAEWTSARPTGQQIADAWDADSLARTNVFRSPGDADSLVLQKANDFAAVQQAQLNFDRALDNFTVNGNKLEGPSSGPSLGDQARVTFDTAQGEFVKVKEMFEAKYPGMNVESVQHQLDDLLADSLRDRPRLVAGGSQPRPAPVPGGNAFFKVNDGAVNFTGPNAARFTGEFDGPVLRVTETDLDGAVTRQLEYSINQRTHMPMLNRDELTLTGGQFEGKRLGAEIEVGLPGQSQLYDGAGGHVPVQYLSGEFHVPSTLGPAKYTRQGEFVGIGSSRTDHLPPVSAPGGMVGDDLARWTAQAEISRTHLTAARDLDEVGDMMQAIGEGRFTSKRGYGGYVDSAFHNGTLEEQVLEFNAIANSLLVDGKIGRTTVYRGVAMDKVAAQADTFIERLPVSTSSEWKFQPQWAKGADLDKRVVFKIDVPETHGKLAMAYPDDYVRGAGDAAPKNQGQFEVTLSPTILERTSEPIFTRDGLTVIPVRAKQMNDTQIEHYLNERWDGLDSAEAFDDFAKAFETTSLQKFPGMSEVTATSKTVGNVNEITVSRAGFEGNDLKITVTRDADADSVKVTATADGKTAFNQSWSREGFANIASDLKAGTLHDNDLFVSMSKPGAWSGKGKEVFNAQWDADLAAKTNLFQRAGDTGAMVDVRMEDFARIKQSQQNLRDADLNVTLHGDRGDGSSFDPAVGHQVKLDLASAQADLDAGKAAFKRKHSMDFDDLQTDVQATIKRAKMDGAGKFFDVPGGNVSFQVENGVVSFAGTQAGAFHGVVNGREVVVTRAGAQGAGDTWTFRLGFGGRPNLTGRTLTLTDGPLAGEVVNLRGMAGQLDGSLGDAGVWPRHLSGDDLIVATPTGPLHYTRDGNFLGPVQTVTRDLGPATPPPHLVNDADGLARWTAQVDSSRTHLTEAMNNKAVENLMKDVMGGSFTSKRGYEGFVKPSALADGTLAAKVNDFNNVTRDLLLKGPDDRMTLYRGVSMDPHAAQADEFVDRLPSSTSNNLGFQEEWAKNGAASNRFVFEIDVPAGHGKLSMAYPKGYEAGDDAAKAWNQSQWEVTLAPTTLIRTGPDRIEDGMRIIPVRAEQIPPGRIADLLSEKWPGMNLDTAYDDFVRAFDEGSVNRWEGFGDVTVSTTKSADGNLTTHTISKPGYGEKLDVLISKDVDGGTVSVKIDGGESAFSKGPWKGTDLADLAAQLRGNVLHDSDLFMRLPQPGAWAQEPVVVNMMHTVVNDVRIQLNGQFGDRWVVRPAEGRPFVDGTDGPLFTVFETNGGGFRVLGPRGETHLYGANGAHLGGGTALADSMYPRGSVFTAADGAGGLRAVDVHGAPVPQHRVEVLGNGQFRMFDDSTNTIRWFGADGVGRAHGIRVQDPSYPGNTYLYRTPDGQAQFVDDAVAPRPGVVHLSQDGSNTFHIVDANGVSRHFDDAGGYLERQVPVLDQVTGTQRVVVHDVNDTLVLRGPAGDTATVSHVQGGGYRVVDNGRFEQFGADGAFQAFGRQIQLPGETAWLEIGGANARWLDNTYTVVQGRTVTVNGTEIHVTRANGHDVFDLQGGLLREVTDLPGNGAALGGSRITRDHNGVVTWADNAGVQMPIPHRATIDNAGGIRIEITMPGRPRHGEYHQFNRGGEITEQGFRVVRDNQPTEFTYVVNRTDNTWQRVRDNGDLGSLGFQKGKVDIVGLENGRIRLQSSTAKEVEVFERRWLPGGEILDSFRKTDTLGFGSLNRRTTWATYDGNGNLTNWGKRHHATAGNAWQDIDHNWRTVRDYQQGLQKYDNPIADQVGPLAKAEEKITGHVLAIRTGDDWTWHRYQADFLHVAQGNRTFERIGEGWTDTVRVMDGGTEVSRVAQQKFGTWHGPDTARQYKEFTLEPGATHPTRDGSFELLSPQLKPVGKGELLPDGTLLSTVRQGDQRPPIWIRKNFLDNPPTTGTVAHIATDNRFQIFRWETTGGPNPGARGVRYVGTDEAIVDVDLNGAFVRSKGKLHDGTELKVGDHATPPANAYPHAQTDVPWTNGDVNGWRVTNGNTWQDFAEVDGQGWRMFRESQPGGIVREYPEPGNAHIWVNRDAHGNLVGMSHRVPGPGTAGQHRYVVATGPADSSAWRWHELDHNGVAIAGREGDRFHFKGSRDESISFDNSFRDFDSAGNLVRDRRMLDERRFIESWNDGGQWVVKEFDKAGVEVVGTTQLNRQWLAADGTWQQNWPAGSSHFRDSTPGGQIVRETPTHVGDGRPTRVREYTMDANGHTDFRQWKEFDVDKVVRERALSGNNYLETDKIHGQWKLYDNTGQVIGERSDNGLVFEFRDGRLRLTGNEFDFRGQLTEFRGWNTRLGDVQRQPWLMQSEWTFADKTLLPGGSAVLREANYAPFSRLLTQKLVISMTFDFVLDYAASLMILGIIAEAQNKPFTGNDALKALMNAAVGTVIKGVAGAALTDTKMLGAFRNLKQNMSNLDGGKLITNRPINHTSTWGAEWAANTGAVKWRAGVFDYGFGMLLLPFTAFVNGAMNAAIFGVPGSDGKSHKVYGWEAVAEGGITAVAGLVSANSVGLLRTGIGQYSIGRYVQKGGIGEMALNMPLRLWEKGMGSLLTPAIRGAIDPPWSHIPAQPPPAPPAGQPTITPGGVILPPGVTPAPSVPSVPGTQGTP